MNTRLLTLAAILAASLSMTATKAEAGERYCREYTRTITVGGVLQSGYGTACYQPDGSWEIVSLSGRDAAQDAVRDRIYDDLRMEDSRTVVIDRYTPVTYYQPPPRYYVPVPFWREAQYYKPRPFGHCKKHDRHDRWDDHDRGDRDWGDRGGRGHHGHH